MSRRVYVRLSGPEIEALVRVASQERRPPADQGAIFIRDALRELGALPSDAQEPPTPTAPR